MGNVLLQRSRLLKVICGGVAACYTANLGPQPRGLARSYYSSQQPTTIVCVFVYREICRTNPMCGGKQSGRFDSMCEGFFFLFERDPDIQTSNCRLHYWCPALKMCTEVAVVKVPRFAACAPISCTLASSTEGKDRDCEERLGNKLVLVWRFDKRYVCQLWNIQERMTWVPAALM